jgi:two-component system sensor histidine kinase MtrB
LLEISRIDAGTAKVELEEIHLLDLVERVLDSLSTVIERLEIDLELMGLEEVGIIHCDVRRTERIVRNLISNAIEHAQGQLVVIAAGSNDQSIALSVRDYGVGLQPGESSLVFNRFWRADPSRQRTLGGTGLGLAISLEDARVQGGWLDADGVPQGGAHFRLTLPRAVGNEITDSPLPLSIAEIDAWIGGLR